MTTVRRGCGTLRTGKALLELKGHTDGVSGASFSPDGARIVTGSFDRTAKVWDARDGTALLELKGHKGYVSGASFSPDGARIVTGSWDKTAKVWDGAARARPCSSSRGTRTV